MPTATSTDSVPITSHRTVTVGAATVASPPGHGPGAVTSNPKKAGSSKPVADCSAMVDVGAFVAGAAVETGGAEVVSGGRVVGGDVIGPAVVVGAAVVGGTVELLAGAAGRPAAIVGGGASVGGAIVASGDEAQLATPTSATTQTGSTRNTEKTVVRPSRPRVDGLVAGQDSSRRATVSPSSITPVGTKPRRS